MNIKKLIEDVITILLWIGFLYSANHYINIELFINTLYIAIVSFIIMIGWKMYNIKRFGGLKRRTYPKDTTIEELVEFFKISEDKIREMQNSKIIVLEKNLFLNSNKLTYKEREMIKMTNELERIAKILGVNTNTEANNLCLLIQDKIKEKDKAINKLTFSNVLLKSQLEKHKAKPAVKEVKVSNDIEYIDEIKSGFDKAYGGLKKEYESILQVNYSLRMEIEKYKDESLRNKIKKIERAR